MVTSADMEVTAMRPLLVTKEALSPIEARVFLPPGSGLTLDGKVLKVSVRRESEEIAESCSIASNHSSLSE